MNDLIYKNHWLVYDDVVRGTKGENPGGSQTTSPGDFQPQEIFEPRK